MLSLLGPMFAGLGPNDEPPHRNGSRLDQAAVRNVYRTGSGDFVAISCGSPRQLGQVAALVAPGETAAPAALDGLVATWIAMRKADEVLSVLLEQRLPVVRVNDARTLQADPHAIARDAIARVTSDERGEALVVRAVPRFETTPTTTPMRCPRLGEDNVEVLGSWLGLTSTERDQLQADRVI